MSMAKDTKKQAMALSKTRNPRDADGDTYSLDHCLQS